MYLEWINFKVFQLFQSKLFPILFSYSSPNSYNLALFNLMKREINEVEHSANLKYQLNYSKPFNKFYQL